MQRRLAMQEPVLRPFDKMAFARQLVLDLAVFPLCHRLNSIHKLPFSGSMSRTSIAARIRPIAGADT